MRSYDLLVWLARPPTATLLVSLPVLIKLFTGSNTSSVEVGSLAFVTCSSISALSLCYELSQQSDALLVLYICHHSTLTRVDEPYPMLVLCGPPGSGKGHFAKVLVDEFPSFFGLG